jgi:hypothetical protein
MSGDTMIALIALIVSVIALGLSIYFWRRQFRPIVTAAVKTHFGGEASIAYDLALLNCGTIPAKNIRITANEASLAQAFGKDATLDNKTRWLACFDPATAIAILHNNDRVSCSLGTTSARDTGFWKYGSKIAVEIRYEGWFGKKYHQSQLIEIIDSDSFTGFMWD